MPWNFREFLSSSCSGSRTVKDLLNWVRSRYRIVQWDEIQDNFDTDSKVVHLQGCSREVGKVIDLQVANSPIVCFGSSS